MAPKLSVSYLTLGSVQVLYSFVLLGLIHMPMTMPEPTCAVCIIVSKSKTGYDTQWGISTQKRPSQ